MTPTGKTITRSVYYGVDFSTSCYSVFMSVSAVAKTFVMRNIFVGEAYYTTRGLRLTSVTSKIQFKAVYVGTTAGTIANATFDFYMLEQTATSAIKDLTSGSISSTTPDILNVTSTNSSSETFIYTK